MKRTKNIIVSTPKKASNSLFAFLILSIIIVIGSLIFQEITKNNGINSKTTLMSNNNETESIAYIANSNDVDETIIEDDTSSNNMLAREASPRTAYLLYDDKDYQHLIRANYLTRNINPDDSTAIRLEQQENRIIGYDTTNNKKISNIKDISNGQQFYAAKILYRDHDNVIILSKQKNLIPEHGYGYIVYYLRGYDGLVISSMPITSLVELDEKNSNVQAYEYSFLITLADKKLKINSSGNLVKL